MREMSEDKVKKMVSKLSPYKQYFSFLQDEEMLKDFVENRIVIFNLKTLEFRYTYNIDEYSVIINVDTKHFYKYLNSHGSDSKVLIKRITTAMNRVKKIKRLRKIS